jgi:predicted pyridoxine 5'-phosphate oxidase superfamily flavin-nucleotide-binding protein
MRREAAQAASKIAAEQERLREQLERLPVAAQESSEGMRRALQDQINALDQLSMLTSRAAVQRDVISPEPAEKSATPPPPPRRTSGKDTARSLTSLSSTIAQELGNRQRQQRPAAGRGGTSDTREGWSLGDLLARASLDDDAPAPPGGGAPRPDPAGSGPARQAPAAFNLDLEAIARALDPATASAVWTRLRAGQRGVMVRSIYSDGGRHVFDEVNQRCRTDVDLSRAISRYLADFERAVAESDLRDPSGRLTQGQLVSDAGRVYLFLAHASGRLA